MLLCEREKELGLRRKLKLAPKSNRELSAQRLVAQKMRRKKR